ncbi:hypothetical protein F5Y17DRAFT_429586 [Xylariaceae sp. FL0594]|nr:hypothetical protein F5Y17DRAFT_429586 [Xylariaceae sp. FL0594]
MRPKRFHGLAKPKLRQSWNKHNLFNIWKMTMPLIGRPGSQTFFQQKWRAKGMMRAYHGEHIVERKWTRMFDRRLLGVVEMSPSYLARNDGSEMAEGRGSGLATLDKKETDLRRIKTPYMQMVFAPMERRLDIAVFRAMFASSARQARQFCVHGAVKVNGKVVPFPSYRLNPGDMFQVDPERVLYATGQQMLSRKEYEKFRKNKRALEAKSDALRAQKKAGENTSESKAEVQAEGQVEAEAHPDTDKWTRPQVERLAQTIKTLVQEKGLHENVLRRFMIRSRRALSRLGRPGATPADITERLSSLLSEFGLMAGSTNSVKQIDTLESKQLKDATASTAESKSLEESEKDKQELTIESEDLGRLKRLMEEREESARDNPFEPWKPYLTPWRPREFMSAFAFIPRYLEVNHKICSAVYLRHPVARPGMAEVPTPFPDHYSQLVYNWYLRRR